MKLSAAAIALLTSTANAVKPQNTGNPFNAGLAARLEAAEATISAANATISALTARVQVLESTERIVFVTSDSYTGGAIGGIPGAHSKCQNLANAAGLSGTFRPWLSSSTFSPAQDFDKSGGPFVMRNDVIVADNWQDLITKDGSNRYLDYAISVNENGDLSIGGVWTGTDVTGMPESAGQDFCDDWTGIRNTAQIGISSKTDSLWTSAFGAGCSNAYRLFCFEQ